MAAITICSDFGAQENKICHCFCFFPSICHEGMGPDTIILLFWMLSFKPVFSLSYFTLIKRFSSSSSLSAIRMVVSAFLRLFICLPAVVIPAWDSSILALHMMYSAYKLNKQGDSIQPWRTPFPVWNQSVVPCPVLTVASWRVYSGFSGDSKMVWYLHLFKNFPWFVVIHTVKGFRVFNETEWSESHSVVSNSLQPYGLYSPGNSSGQNTGVGSNFLLQGIFSTQGLPSHFRLILYQLNHQGSPFIWNFLALSMIQQMLEIWSLVPLPFLNPACTSEVLKSHTAKA